MARVYNLGIESFVLNSYDGWDETDVGVQFYNCDFKVFSGLDRYDGYTLHLNYAEARLEIFNGDFMVYTDGIKLVRT
ncbi:hypothetical protein CNR37_00151 [Pseudomonas phage ventosus]|uniref:Uncharacterized protein n=1 Tax=Pseudomonas phage ventosus TaxID=2048980 RepID=A0A2H4P863_9CAUD|nr:hypothetical protein CNR37_00151 [Pseudomonas phage ventosus]